MRILVLLKWPCFTWSTSKHDQDRGGGQLRGILQLEEWFGGLIRGNESETKLPVLHVFKSSSQSVPPGPSLDPGIFSLSNKFIFLAFLILKGEVLLIFSKAFRHTIKLDELYSVTKKFQKWSFYCFAHFISQHPQFCFAQAYYYVLIVTYASKSC